MGLHARAPLRSHYGLHLVAGGADRFSVAPERITGKLGSRCVRERLSLALSSKAVQSIRKQAVLNDSECPVNGGVQESGELTWQASCLEVLR